MGLPGGPNVDQLGVESQGGPEKEEPPKGPHVVAIDIEWWRRRELNPSPTILPAYSFTLMVWLLRVPPDKTHPAFPGRQRLLPKVAKRCCCTFC